MITTAICSTLTLTIAVLVSVSNMMVIPMARSFVKPLDSSSVRLCCLHAAAPRPDLRLTEFRAGVSSGHVPEVIRLELTA